VQITYAGLSTATGSWLFKFLTLRQPSLLLRTGSLSQSAPAWHWCPAPPVILINDRLCEAPGRSCRGSSQVTIRTTSPALRTGGG
jgi:hypothetical protein